MGKINTLWLHTGYVSDIDDRQLQDLCFLHFRIAKLLQENNPEKMGQNLKPNSYKTYCAL